MTCTHCGGPTDSGNLCASCSDDFQREYANREREARWEEKVAPLTELALSLVAKHGVDRYPTLELNCLKLLEEAGELARCILRGEDPAAEMADVEICLRVLAHKAGVSIEDAVAGKVSTDARTFA